MSLKLKRLASLSLSINAIVILILAITMLGLGLGFMRNIFGQATEEFTRVGGTVQKQMIDQMRESQRTVDISRPKLVIRQGGKDQVFLGFKNDQSGDVDFSIGDISGKMLEPVGGVGTSEIIECRQEDDGSTSPQPFPADPTPTDNINEMINVHIGYKKSPTIVKQGEVAVVPLNIKVEPNTPTGTCFFDIRVSRAGSTTPKRIELTIDIIP